MFKAKYEAKQEFPLGLENLQPQKPCSQEKITNSNFWIIKEYPQKSQIWQSETNPNQGIPIKFPNWDLSHSSKFQIFVAIL